MNNQYSRDKQNSGYGQGNNSRPTYGMKSGSMRNERFTKSQDNNNRRRDGLEKEYPIHSDIQSTVNILQKLYASNSDAAINQKNMDYNDSDFRMLPLKVAGIASRYSFGLKLFFLIHFCFLFVLIRFHILVEYGYLLGTLTFLFFFSFPGAILRGGQQYISGEKTKKYYKKMMSGWMLFEILFYFLILSIIFFYYVVYSDSFNINNFFEKFVHFQYVSRLGITLETITQTIKHFFYSSIFFFSLYQFSNFLANRKARKLQIVNVRNHTIENRREEVPDQLLKGIKP